MSNLEQASLAKLGRVTTPGGAAGDNVAQAVAATVGKLGPLVDGYYTLEATVKCFVLQVGKALFDAPPSAATVAAEGVIVPADSEVTFNVDRERQDFYLLWVRDTADGLIRVNDRSNARMA